MISKLFQTMRMNNKKLKSKDLNRKKRVNNNQKRLKQKLRMRNQYNHHQKLYKKEERSTSQRRGPNII